MNPLLSIQPFVAKLSAHTHLARDDRDRLLSLPWRTASFPAGRYIFRAGDAPHQVIVMTSGTTYRHRLLADGARQILALHFRGDAPDLQNATLGTSFDNIQAVGEVEVALLPYRMLSSLADESPAIARALFAEALTDAMIQREWTVNVGRRDARTRIAHLICEIALRSETAGLGTPDQFRMPLTQEQIGDATALTAVHVNRVLQELRRHGLIETDGRLFGIPDWTALAEAGQFDPDYLRPPAEPAVEKVRCRV